MHRKAAERYELAHTFAMAMHDPKKLDSLKPEEPRQLERPSDDEYESDEWWHDATEAA